MYGQACPPAIGGAGTCPAGTYYDSNPSSPTYGQCPPSGQAALQSQLTSSGGGGGGGMPSSPDQSQDQGNAPASALTSETHAAPAKSNTMLYLGLGALVLGGLYLYSKSKKGKRK
jgi:hypothetical protein